MLKFKNYIKKIARIVLSEEIAERERLIKRLQSYAYPYAPDLVDDGTDQTYNLQYRLDVGIGFIPVGNFKIKSTIIL